MNIQDLRRVVPINPSNKNFLDLRRNNQQKNQQKNNNPQNNDFNSILQDEINKNR